MKNGLILTMAAFILLMATGCETYKGAKEDTAKGAEWSKDKVKKGAKYHTLFVTLF